MDIDRIERPTSYLAGNNDDKNNEDDDKVLILGELFRSTLDTAEVVFIVRYKTTIFGI